MTARRKIVKADEPSNVLMANRIFAEIHTIEGTRLYVVELPMWGFAYSSKFLLLKRTSLLSQLDDVQTWKEMMGQPSRIGKNLSWDVEIDLDKNGAMFYIAEVADKDLV